MNSCDVSSGRLRRRWRAMPRRIRIVILAVSGMAVIGVGAASAFWSGTATQIADAAFAQSVNSGTQPTVVPVGSVATVSWAASTLADGAAVDGYLVNRYNAGNTAQTVNAGCSGTIAGLSCTETSVPDGTWKYTVTPVVGQWRGTESAPTTAAVGATQLVFTTPARSAVAGTSTPSMTLERRDPGGNPTTVGSVVVTLTSSAVTASFRDAGDLPLSPATVTIPDGSSSVTFKYRDTVVGSPVVTAASALPSTTQTVTVTPGVASQVSFTTQASSSIAGAPFSSQPVVTVKDAFGNTVTTATNSIDLSPTPATGSPGAVLTCTNNTVAAVAGVATFAGCAIDKAGLSYTLTASSAGLTSGSGAAFNITAGAAAKLTFAQQPSDTAAGSQISPALTVRIEDSLGNLTTSTANVTMAIGTNPGGGSLSGTTTVAASGGIATFSTLSINNAGIGYTLTSTSGALTSSTSLTFFITAGAAAKLTFLQQPSTATAGVAFSPALTVRVEDSLGNLTTSTANVTMAIGTNPGGGTLSGTTTVAAVSGTATFSNLSINAVGTGYTLTATGTGLTSATSSTFNITPGPTKLNFLQQPTNASATVAISPAITVRIEDVSGNLTTSTANVTIAIGTNPGGGTLSGTATVAAVSGIATFSNLSINNTGTGYTLTATSTGLTSKTSSTFNITPAPSKLTYLQQPTTATAGASVSPAVTVRIEDASGGLTTSTANVTIAIGTNPGGGTLAGTTTVAAVGGVATFSNLSIDKVGTGYTLTATSTGLTSKTSSTFNITVGTAAKLTFLQQPTSATAGVSVSPSVTVRIEDASGNLTTSTASVTVAIGTNPGGGTLSGTKTVAAVSGVATFSTLSINLVGTGYTLSATATGLTTGTSSTFNITVATASKLTFLQQPTTAIHDVAVSPAVTVRIEDAFGNLTASTASVTVAIGTNPAAGTLAGTKTVAAVGGVATFSTLSINLVGTGYTLTAASTGLTSATGSAFNIVAGAATKLTYLQQPTNVVAGVSLSPAMTVRIEDALGNLTTSTASVTIAIGTNPGSGTLSGSATVSAVGGVATFSTLSIDKVGTGYTLTATSSGLTSVTSSTFNVTVAAASKLTFLQQPSNATAGASNSPSVTVRIEDAFGNLTASTASITVAIGTNPGGGTLSGTKTVAAVAGVATFSTLSIDIVGTGYTFSATGTGLTSATSSAFNITVGAANKLTYLQQPTSESATVSIAPAVTVRIEDAFGNLTTSTASVTIAILFNAGGGTLSGTKTVAAVAGVASFSNLSIDKVGTGYTLRVTSTGLTSATSSAFNITAAPTKLTFSQQPTSATAGVTIAPAITVRIEDSAGALTTSTASVTMAIGTNAGGGTLSGTKTVPAVGGVATFSGLSIDLIGTGYTLTATSTGLTSKTSTTFNITAAAATKLTFLQQPTSEVHDVALSPAVTVRIEDTFGNVTASTASVTMAIGTNPGGGTLSGTQTVAAVGGVATFSTLSINNVGTGYTLTATGTGLASATSATFNITPGAAAKLTYLQQPVNESAGVVLTPAITVRIEDSAGNLTTSTASVAMAIGTNPNGGSLSGTKTVAAVAGIATFSTLSINNAGTGYTLKATSSGLTLATSTAFNITATPSKLTYLQPPSTTTAGVVIAPDVTVRIEDTSGNLTTSNANVTIAIGTNAGGGTLSGTKTVAAANGLATFTDLSINLIGSGYTLTVTSTGLTAATSATFDITAGPDAKLTYLQQPTSKVAGVALSPAVTVRIEDALGNLTSSTANVTMSIGTNPGGGTLAGTTTVAAVGGVATFSTLSVNKVGTGYTLAATGTGLTSATSSTFNITVGAAAQLMFLQEPTDEVAGVSIAPAVTVRIEDAFGNLTNSNANVTVAIGTNPGGGTLAGTTTRAASSGLATFSNLSINLIGNAYTLTATGTGLTPDTSTTFNVTPGTATKLTYLQQPTSAVAGVSIAPAVTVRIEDALGNLTTSTANVTMAIGTNPGGGTLSGTKTVAAVSGVATFSTLSIDSAGTAYTLTATSTGLTSKTSTSFNITAGTASKLTYLQQPTSEVAGVSIAPAITVRIEDSFGNLTASTANVTVAIGTNPSGGTLSGTTTVTAVGGVGTFSSLSINLVGTGYTLAATSTGLTPTTSSVFNITVGAAAKLTVLQQPSSAVAGVAVAPSVTVRIEDSFGNLTASTANVTMAIGTNAGGGTLSGTKTVAAVGGVATFSTLSINKTGTGYTLVATSTGLTSATSSTFDISVAAAAQVTFLQQPTNTVRNVAIAPALTVRIEDAFGNLTTSTASITIAISTNPASGTLSGTKTVAAVT